MDLFESSVKRLLEDDFGNMGEDDPDDPDDTMDEIPPEEDMEEGDDLADMSLGELIDEYQDRHRMWHFEGPSGVRNFEKLAAALGYGGYGGILQNFFEDNPGAIEAVIEWIGEQNLQDWKSSLLDAMH